MARLSQLLPPRWQSEELTPKDLPFPQSGTEGTEIAGKTVLVVPEQGFGDAILFAPPFFPELRKTRGPGAVSDGKPLARLFDGIAGHRTGSASPALPRDAPRSIAG